MTQPETHGASAVDGGISGAIVHQRKQGMPASRNFWKPGRTFSRAELVADGIVHGVGIVCAIVAGSVLLALTVFKATPEEMAAAAIYVGTLVAVLSFSMAFNMWPLSPAKRL